MVSGDEIALLVSGLKQDKQGEKFSSSLAKVIRGGLPHILSMFMCKALRLGYLPLYYNLNLAGA